MSQRAHDSAAALARTSPHVCQVPPSNSALVSAGCWYDQGCEVQERAPKLGFRVGRLSVTKRDHVPGLHAEHGSGRAPPAHKRQVPVRVGEEPDGIALRHATWPAGERAHAPGRHRGVRGHHQLLDAQAGIDGVGMARSQLNVAEAVDPQDLGLDPAVLHVQLRGLEAHQRVAGHTFSQFLRPSAHPKARGRRGEYVSAVEGGPESWHRGRRRQRHRRDCSPECIDGKAEQPVVGAYEESGAARLGDLHRDGPSVRADPGVDHRHDHAGAQMRRHSLERERTRTHVERGYLVRQVDYRATGRIAQRPLPGARLRTRLRSRSP